MHRKELWVPLTVVGLTVAFALVSLLVRWSRGNPWLVRRKLRLGALLLALTWSSAGCDEGVISCYDPVEPELPTDDLRFDPQFQGARGLELDLASGHALTGAVHLRRAERFAYQLLGSDLGELRRGELVPADGAFDRSDELFVLDLGADIAPAVYALRVFAEEIDGGQVVLERPLLVRIGS